MLEQEGRCPVEEITEDAEIVQRVAALDIGKASLTACVRVPHEDKPGRRRQEVRTFATTTRSLLELRDWLVCAGVTLCVMEATSTYWKPPFYLLEDAIECWVVNARDVKNVPGRPKTDPLTELLDVSAAQKHCSPQQSIAAVSGRSQSPGRRSLVASPVSAETGHTKPKQPTAYSSLPIFNVSHSRP